MKLIASVSQRSHIGMLFLASHALTQGDKVTLVFGEDLSLSDFTRRNEIVSKNLFSVQSLNDALSQIERNEETIVLLAENYPGDNEREVARAAAALRATHGIKLVKLQDFWRATTVYDVPFDHVLTLDRVSKRLDKDLHHEVPVTVVGNPAIKVRIDHEIVSQYSELKRQEYDVYFYAGGHPSESPAAIRLLVDALRRTMGKWRLVVSLHPRHQDCWNEWRALFKPVQDSVQYAEDKSDDWAGVADMMLSGYGSLMATALYHHRQCAALLIPETRHLIRSTLGITTLPLVELRYVHELSMVRDLRPLAYEEAINRRACMHPFNATTAYRALCRLW